MSFNLKIRQAEWLNVARRFQNQGALDGVAQLTHVSGPAMRKQFLLRGGSDAVYVLVHCGAEHP